MAKKIKMYSKDEIIVAVTMAVRTELTETNKSIGIEKFTSNDYMVLGVVSQALKRL